MASTDTTRELFFTGLRNAHAMENEALSIMRPQLKRIENYPAVAQRLEQHIRETEGQIERLATILDRYGQDNSALKDTASSMMGTMAAASHTMAGDEILKNSFANFAFENFEIAAYNSLLVMAQAAGASSDLDALQANLREEESMARWLSENLAATTQQFLALSETGDRAKV